MDDRAGIGRQSPPAPASMVNDAVVDVGEQLFRRPLKLPRQFGPVTASPVLANHSLQFGGELLAVVVPAVR